MVNSIQLNFLSKAQDIFLSINNITHTRRFVHAFLTGYFDIFKAASKLLQSYFSTKEYVIFGERFFPFALTSFSVINLFILTLIVLVDTSAFLANSIVVTLFFLPYNSRYFFQDYQDFPKQLLLTVMQYDLLDV